VLAGRLLHFGSRVPTEACTDGESLGIELNAGLTLEAFPSACSCSPVSGAAEGASLSLSLSLSLSHIPFGYSELGLIPKVAFSD